MGCHITQKDGVKYGVPTTEKDGVKHGVKDGASMTMVKCRLLKNDVYESRPPPYRVIIENDS